MILYWQHWYSNNNRTALQETMDTGTVS